ncbi:MAG: hypothetical protein KGJ13_11565 [Patescibacteria group bacterium]|nr:hypothetical protein [Patescibacteria group bacterium]
MSQSDAILEALKRGDTITPLDALQKYRCLRLSGRIYDLKAKGYPIEMRLIETPSGKRVAEYYLTPVRKGENYKLAI